MAADLRFQAIYTFNTLISMVTLIIDSCCGFVKTSDLTPLVALNSFPAFLLQDRNTPGKFRGHASGFVRTEKGKYMWNCDNDYCHIFICRYPYLESSKLSPRRPVFPYITICNLIGVSYDNLVKQRRDPHSKYNTVYLKMYKDVSLALQQR